MAIRMRQKIIELEEELNDADAAMDISNQNQEKLVLDNKVLRDGKDAADKKAYTYQTSHQGYKEGVQDVVKEILKALR
jgi:hypothetical protein